MSLENQEKERADWEWPPERIREFGYRPVDVVANHLTGRVDRPVFRPFPRDRANRYLAFEPPPETGEPEDRTLETLRPAAISIFAEMLAAAINPSCAGGNHAAVYVERQVSTGSSVLPASQKKAWVVW